MSFTTLRKGARETKSQRGDRRVTRKEEPMSIQADKQYRVIRSLPRKGEVYAVTNRRTGVTTLKTANKDFNRDKRRVLIAA